MIELGKNSDFTVCFIREINYRLCKLYKCMFNIKGNLRTT